MRQGKQRRQGDFAAAQNLIVSGNFYLELFAKLVSGQIVVFNVVYKRRSVNFVNHNFPPFKIISAATFRYAAQRETHYRRLVSVKNLTTKQLIIFHRKK